MVCPMTDPCWSRSRAVLDAHLHLWSCGGQRKPLACFQPQGTGKQTLADLFTSAGRLHGYSGVGGGG